MINMSFKTGHVPDIPDPDDHSVTMDKMDMDVSVPNVFDIFGEPLNYQEKVFNQHQVNSCVTNAVAAAYLYELQRQQVTLPNNYAPSRLFLYYVARYLRDQTSKDFEEIKVYIPRGDEAMVVDGGCMPRDAIKIMKFLGAPREVASPDLYVPDSGTWPHDDNVKASVPVFDGAGKQIRLDFDKDDWPASVPDAACFANDKLHAALNYARPEMNSECWKRCIHKGYPVFFAIRELDSWYQWSRNPAATNFVSPVPLENEVSHGGHAMLIVGWDDSIGGTGCFKVQNSWGDNWGNKGFFWLPYEWLNVKGAINDRWTFMKGS
ncbi:hypothetical protein B0H67DRAFT_323091 [Lasiosphaeris hirsuta]|uniref:Peptidase C1A papain C-terminal domain-containing protein n=1 Tax=Lasiosphaeris hirsuta TaxID=260670 RepID=A0AA40DL92_9PEZI|nr:hypothetical protein B0H67DRAFT_323091 [Lasiosphaeris hirsuta]